MVNAVVGLNWGDEGKGRIVDYLASRADCVIRFQGGDNAGHTIMNGFGKTALHNFPSGIFNGNCLNIIAPGSVINPESFAAEKRELDSRGVCTDNIIISDRSVIILPFHILLDRLEEERLGKRKYGSTLSGIAPVYGLRYMKKGIQAGELLHPAYLEEHAGAVLEYVNAVIKGVYGSEPVKLTDVLEWLEFHGRTLKPLIADIGPIIDKLLLENKSIILEAQLGALRDITHGIYPYTTSSSTLAAYACASVPIPPSSIGEVIGVTKAYSTCVGEGPFITEMEPAQAEALRNKAGEFGAKTGRPRRIGHFDAVAAAYGCRLQGATGIALTCLDVLSGMGELKICMGYRTGGGVIGSFPVNPALEAAEPVYETLEGWEEGISDVRCLEKLPPAAKSYMERIERLTGVKIRYVSVGPAREEMFEII